MILNDSITMRYYNESKTQILVHNYLLTLREILLIVLTKRSQLYIFSKRYQKFCKTYQYVKVDGTKYTTNFFL